MSDVPAAEAGSPPRHRPRPPVLQPLRRLPNRRRRSAEAQGPLRPFINLCGDYRFLRAGYWALVDAELNGFASSPTPVQAVTAQNAAACLLVARHAGIDTVEWQVARRPQDVEPPSLLVPVSGLTERCYEVKSTRSRASQWRSATQNGTRAALAVRMGGELRSLRMIVGVTAHENFHLAWDVWRTFGVPLAEIWYLERDDSPGKPLFLGLDPLPLHELSERELRLFEEVSQRPMEA
ncbi:MAG: hypothetical protein ACYDBQ_12465 [Thermoplasmatota archaeon]